MFTVKRVVIALGGNALEKTGLPPTAESQLLVIKQTAAHIADIVQVGYEVVITHGNGPQVGRILLASEGAAALTPAMPFDVCGAMSQGYIGYHLQQCLQQELQKVNVKKPVATIVTQVLVDKNDKAFQNPSKPIGPFYSEDEAKSLAAEKGYAMKEDAGRGWRRVVPSPLPIGIIEIEPLKALVDNGCVIIACGGGGIPVIKAEDGLEGVPAVIDKDFASERLAEELNADMLVILTVVDKAQVNFNKPDQRGIDLCTAEEMETYIKEGHFAPGSMLPKVEACVKFVKSQAGRTAVISSLEHAGQAIEGKAGTRITG